MSALRRRDLVVAAAATAFAARSVPAAAQALPAAEVLTSALRFEQAGLAAYDAVLAARAFGGGELRRLQRLRDQEAEHVAALGRAARDLGVALPAPPAGPEQVEVPQLRAGIDALDGRPSALALLVGLERLSLDVHRAALGTLREAGHIRLVATILATEATHLAAWRAVG